MDPVNVPSAPTSFSSSATTPTGTSVPPCRKRTAPAPKRNPSPTKRAKTTKAGAIYHDDPARLERASVCRFASVIHVETEANALKSLLEPYIEQSILRISHPKSKDHLTLSGVLLIKPGKHWKTIRDVLSTKKSYMTFGPSFTSEADPRKELQAQEPLTDTGASPEEVAMGL